MVPTSPGADYRAPETCGTSHNAQCWLCTDSCGLVCALVTSILILFSQWTMTKQLWYFGDMTVHSRLDMFLGKLRLGRFLKVANLLFYNAVGCLALTSHLRAMFADPGAVPKNAEPLPGDVSRLRDALQYSRKLAKRGWCHRCGAYKPPRAHHCSVTGRCIVKLDHYCPWTNNAIGVKNHKFFLLFIFYTFILCAYSLAVVIHIAYDAMRRDLPTPFGVGALVVGTCAVLFGLFTSCMLCDQYSVLSTNVAKIDRLKNQLTTVSEINEVFGGRSRGFHLHWLLPIAPHFPDSVKDDVFGFRVPDDSSSPGSGSGADGNHDPLLLGSTSSSGTTTSGGPPGLTSDRRDPSSSEKHIDLEGGAFPSGGATTV